MQDGGFFVVIIIGLIKMCYIRTKTFIFMCVSKFGQIKLKHTKKEPRRSEERRG